MKNLNSRINGTCILLLSLGLLSCKTTFGPIDLAGLYPVKLQYIGESYPPSASVEVYYNAQEVKKEYTVMGRMTNDKSVQNDSERIKQEMISRAKLVGADAILFYDLTTELIENYGSAVAVKAEVLKYK